MVRNLKDFSFSPDQLKLKTAQDHLKTHIIVNFLYSLLIGELQFSNRLLEEIIEQVRTPESRDHYKAPEVAVSDL